MGRLSQRWGATVALYMKKTHEQFQTMRTAQTINCLWKYTCSAWGYRNTVVHGATDQEMADKIREQTTKKA